MSSELLKAYTTTYTHTVGNLNSFKVRTLPYGAKVDTADIDNFTIVELGFNTDGERICKQLSAKGNKGYLIVAPERRYIEGEPMVNYFNAVGDLARIVFLDEGLRFETSAFTLNTGVTAIKNGLVAHFDVTTKKFIISDSTAAHADYAGSKDKFTVVNDESDECYTIDGKELVRLEKQV